MIIHCFGDLIGLMCPDWLDLRILKVYNSTISLYNLEYKDLFHFKHGLTVKNPEKNMVFQCIWMHWKVKKIELIWGC